MEPLIFDHRENIFCDAMKRQDVEACISAVFSMPGVTPILCAVQSAYMCHADKEVEEQGHMYYHHLTFLNDLHDCPELAHVVKVALYIDDNRAAEETFSESG